MYWDQFNRLSCSTESSTQPRAGNHYRQQSPCGPRLSHPPSIRNAGWFSSRGESQTKIWTAQKPEPERSFSSSVFRPGSFAAVAPGWCGTYPGTARPVRCRPGARRWTAWRSSTAGCAGTGRSRTAAAPTWRSPRPGCTTEEGWWRRWSHWYRTSPG